MKTNTSECIFPLSPYQVGGTLGLRNYALGEQVVETTGTVALAHHSANGFFAMHTDKDLASIEVADTSLNRTLVERPDFMAGLLDIVKIHGESALWTECEIEKQKRINAPMN